jgi:hypothetical protein
LSGCIIATRDPVDLPGKDPGSVHTGAGHATTRLFARLEEFIYEADMIRTPTWTAGLYMNGRTVTKNIDLPKQRKAPIGGDRQKMINPTCLVNLVAHLVFDKYLK